MIFFLFYKREREIQLIEDKLFAKNRVRNKISLIFNKDTELQLVPLILLEEKISFVYFPLSSVKDSIELNFFNKRFLQNI
mgnify:CR=1 FL=1